MLGSLSQNVLSMQSSEIGLISSTSSVAPKTPAWSSKHGRTVRDENAIHDGPRTAGHTKRKKRNAAALGTPAIGTVLNQLRPHFKTEKISRTAGKSTALSEITNKTPFNKPQFPVTPVPASLKPSRSFAISNDASEIISARRISSTRKKLRLPKSASKIFETPETRGNYWDVSDMSMEVSVIEEASEAAEDYDDVEYGPPTAIDPTYEPPFEIPDYKKVGATLMSLFRQQTIPEGCIPLDEFEGTELLAELKFLEWGESLELPEIPLENIFPSMVQSDPLLSLTVENKPQPRNVQRNTIPTFTSIPHPPIYHSSKFNSAVRHNPAANTRITSSRSNALPVNPISKPVCRTLTPHTRIPSLTNVVQMSARVTDTGIPTRSHSQAIIGSHSRATSVSRSSPKSVSHLRNTSVPQPSTFGKGVHKAKLFPLQMPEDTLGSLLADTRDEAPGEEFLFDI